MAAVAYSGASSSCLACLFLLFATCSPWTMYSSYTSFNGVFTSFGVGPFVAGASTSYFSSGTHSYYAGVVWWADLNTHNTCSPSSPLFATWAGPNGLCIVNKNTNSTTFQLPSQIQGIQASIVLATIFSFISTLLGCSMSKNKTMVGSFALLTSLVAMVFSIGAFAVWTTWSMSLKLQSIQGDFIPLYSTPDKGKTIVISPSPLPVSMFYGWTYLTTIFAFILLILSSLSFAQATHMTRPAEYDDDGDYGAGSDVNRI